MTYVRVGWIAAGPLPRVKSPKQTFEVRNEVAVSGPNTFRLRSNRTEFFHEIIHEGSGRWLRSLPAGKQRMGLDVSKPPSRKQLDQLPGIKILGEGWEARNSKPKTGAHGALNRSGFPGSHLVCIRRRPRLAPQPE